MVGYSCLAGCASCGGVEVIGYTDDGKVMENGVEVVVWWMD